MTTANDSPKTFGFVLNTASRLMRRRFDQRAKEIGLSRAQAQALFFIQRSEGSNQACLAEAMEIEPITLTRVLDRMEEAGWIERRADPKDRRIRRLFLTAVALPILEESRRIADEIYEEAFAGLPPDARTTIMSILERMSANMSERVCAHRQAAESKPSNR